MTGVFDVTAKGLLQRRQALLVAPVLPFDQFAPIARDAGLEDVQWPAIEPSNRRRDRIGYIYFARCPGDVVKIGFSVCPAQRMATLQYQCVGLLCWVQMQHEFRLHWLLSDERVENEVFAGPKTECLLSGIAEASRVTYGSFQDCAREIDWIRSTMGEVPAGEVEHAKRFPIRKVA